MHVFLVFVEVEISAVEFEALGVIQLS